MPVIIRRGGKSKKNGKTGFDILETPLSAVDKSNKIPYMVS